MAYRLKRVRYQNHDCHILLQNENGPCPLLAAANSLLLKQSIQLPSNCIGANVVTIDQLINILAEKVLMNHQPDHGQNQNHPQQEEHHFAVSEVLNVFPSLQYGMDVNPKFTKGPTGVEYTMQLNAFDLLHVDLVHGWLIDPVQQTLEYALMENQTYNQLVNKVISGNEARSELERIILLPPGQQALIPESKQQELAKIADHGTVIHNFLQQSGHQLTQYGLETLYTHVKEQDMVVFFRNNHFNTLTKQDGLLYLLVTDLGYANVDIVWEKLDVIDGDTEYMTANFKPPPPLKDLMAGGGAAATGEQLVANNSQSQSDYHLALQLSQENNNSNNNNTNNAMTASTTAAIPAPATMTATSAATSAVNTISNTFAAAAAALNFPTTAVNSKPLDATLAPVTAHDRELEAARQASLELYQQQQRQQQQHHLQAGFQPPPPAQQQPPQQQQQRPVPQVHQHGPGSVPRVPVGRPSPLAGIPTVAVGIPATLAPRQPAATTAATTTATTTPTASVSFASNLTQQQQPPITVHNHLEEQDRWLALQMQHDDGHEASQKLALQLEREEQRRSAASSRRQAAPPPRRQPTVAPNRNSGSDKDEKCVIS